MMPDSGRRIQAFRRSLLHTRTTLPSSSLGRRSGARGPRVCGIAFPLAASWLLAIAVATLVPATAAAAPAQMIGRFLPGALDGWERKSFRGETRYRLVGYGKTRALEATCNGTASAIVKRVSVDLSRTPVLRWQWRVDHVYKGLNGTTKAGDDYAARIYVIHDGGVLFWRTRAINYVWANSQPAGAHWPSPFTNSNMMVAVQSGPPLDPGS